MAYDTYASLVARAQQVRDELHAKANSAGRVGQLLVDIVDSGGGAVYNVLSYGADPTGVADSTAAIQAAIDAVGTAGSGVVFFPPGTYLISTGLDIGGIDGLVIQGAGLEVVTLDWANTANCLFTGYQTRHTQTGLRLEGITIRGKWDVYQEDAPAYSPVYIQGVDEVCIHKVRIENCTYFGFVTRECERVTVTSCQCYEIGRDQISCAETTQVTITDNIIDHGDDEAITVSIRNDAPLSVLQGSVIANNRISDSQGIFVLGMRKGVISGNQIDRCRFHGIYVGAALGTDITTTYAVSITGNVITDIFNRYTIDGLSDGNNYIVVAGREQVGSGVAVPGLPQNSTGTFEPLLEALNNNAGTLPIAPSHWVQVTGNVCSRTLPSGVDYSDYGWGEMFTRNGYLDPAVTEAMLSTTSRGIYVGVGRCVSIADNIFSGQNQGCSLYGAFADFVNIHITNNIFYNFSNSGIVCSSVTGGRNILVSGNTFDGDPYHAHSNRGPGGTWATDGLPFAIYVGNAEGFDARGNVFRRVCNISDVATNGTSNRVAWKDNVWECNPVATGFATSNVGIGDIPRGGGGGVHRIVGGDPAAATSYETTINLCPEYLGSIPTTGTYVSGHFVRNTVAGTSGVIGWLRITTGSTHSATTDWTAV